MNFDEKKMYDYWRNWFAQPAAEKVKLLRSPGKGGYYPPASEAPGFTGTPDAKEYFHWRLDHGAGGGGHLPTYNVFCDCLQKAEDWLRARGLTELINSAWDKNHVLRIIHYPPSPTGSVGQAHRDFDLLTVSVDAEVPGLEVYDENARSDSDGWLPGWTSQEVGIQSGEMLEIYTDGGGKGDELHGIGLYQEATLHRVQTPANTERYKAVFFYLPPSDFELRTGYTAADYLKEVLSKAGTYNIGKKP